LQTRNPPAAQPRKSLSASAFRLTARGRRIVVSRIVVYAMAKTIAIKKLSRSEIHDIEA
jgi:hypothetical protein